MLYIYDLPRTAIAFEKLCPTLALFYKNRELLERLSPTYALKELPVAVPTQAQIKQAAKAFGVYTKGRKIVDLAVLRTVLKYPAI